MIEKIYQYYLESGRVSTDTRKIKSGDVFFALQGPNFNANEFAQSALEKGAAIAIIDDAAYQKDDRCIVVKDTLNTLQQLAKHHRTRLNIPVIGLTGSNGKTTTKELMKVVLSQKYNTIATAGNLNNHIGVPLTLLGIEKTHEIAIIEMGANHLGEIKSLCEIANPTHGLITNIGKAHLEGFGGFDGVIRAKSELYHHLIKTGGTVWINSQNDILKNMAKRFDNPLFYPGVNDYYPCSFIDASPYVALTAENGEQLKTHLVGKYNFENIAAALCVGKFFEVAASAANAAIANYTPQNNRSQVIQKGANTIILDAYNANPSSMASAIDNLSQMDVKNKMVILGDMKELGPESEREHKKLGVTLAERDFDEVYLCGDHIEHAARQLKGAHYFKNKTALIQALSETNIDEMVILIKASRSLGLEDVVEYL